MLLNKNIYYFLFLIWTISACEEKTPFVPPAEEDPIEGVFIINEGSFQSANASISFYDLIKEEVTAKYFQQANGRALGDILQSMTIVGDKAYLMINNSRRVEAVNFPNLKLSNGFFQKSPRYLLPVGSQKAYSTDLRADQVYILNMEQAEVTDSISIYGHGEEMAQVEDEVYICVNGSDFYRRFDRNKVFVVDQRIDEVVDSIEVGLNPISIRADKNNNLWVLCAGDASKNVFGGLYKINSATHEVDLALPFRDLEVGFAQRLRMNPAKDRVYFTKVDIYALPIEATALPTQPLIDAQNNPYFAYGLDVHPDKGHLWVGNALDFAQSGEVYEYDDNGNLLKTINAGVGPNGFVFYKN